MSTCGVIADWLTLLQQPYKSAHGSHTLVCRSSGNVARAARTQLEAPATAAVGTSES
jgi:hypothetical protein